MQPAQQAARLRETRNEASTTTVDPTTHEQNDDWQRRSVTCARLPARWRPALAHPVTLVERAARMLDHSQESR